MTKEKKLTKEDIVKLVDKPVKLPSMVNDDFDLKKFAKTLKNKFGSVRVPSMEDDPSEYISTGNKALDAALEGGIALGYAAEWAGFSGSGKTTLLQILLADMQKKYDAVGIWFDREKAWFNKRAEELGINLANVIVVDPIDIQTVPDAEKLMKEILTTIPDDKYKFIAIDSISAFAQEGDKADMGKKAGSLHKLFRAIIPYVNKRTSLHFANQKTFKIGVMFGNNETTTGGEAPKYYSTYRLGLNDRMAIKDDKRGGEITGNWIEAIVDKTRLGPNRRKVIFPFHFKYGIPYYGGYARLLVNRNYLQAKNKDEFKSLKQNTVKFGDIQFSEHNIEKFLETHPELDFDVYPEWKEDVKEEKIL